MNYAEFKSFTKKDSKINGIIFEDKNSGEIHMVKSKAVINCTGSFSDNIRKADNP